MNSYLKFLVWAIVIGAIAYFVFYKENTWVYNYPPIQKTREAINESVNKLKIKLQSGLTTITDSAFDLVKEKSEEAVTKAGNEVKNQAFNVVQKAVTGGMNSLGEQLGLSPKISGGDTNTPLSFGVKIGSTAYFSLDNNENEKVGYQADWQDGKKDTGNLDIGKTAILSHKWDKAGDYTLNFKTTSSKGEKQYQIVISIF